MNQLAKFLSSSEAVQLYVPSPFCAVQSLRVEGRLLNVAGQDATTPFTLVQVPPVRIS
jgi:hypothetical protein